MQQALPIEVWSDYACPWCFLTAHNLQKLSSSEQIAIRWRAFELRPKDGPPTPAEHLAKVQAKRPQVYALIRQKHGLKMNPGPFGIDSRPAHIATKVAERAGCGAAFHAALMAAYWLEAQNIEDATVLADIALGIGLEREAFLVAMQQPQFRQAVIDDRTLARQQTLRTVPTLIFAKQYVATGAQSLDALQQILTRIQNERSQPEQQEIA